jgi:peptidase M49-like protein
MHRSLVRWGALFALASACDSTPPPPAPPPPAPAPPPPTPMAAPPPAKPAPDAAALRAKVAQFAPVTLTADLSKLPPAEKQALDELVAAAKLLDPVFDRQAWVGNPALREKLEADASPEGRLKLEYFTIMRGPWDRQDHFKPFAVASERPKGAGFYPEDLTADAFRAYLAAHPEDKASLEGLTTVVRREGDKLAATPYHEAYKQWLEPVAERLERAGKLTKNASLRKYLASRAKALRTDDYYQSDKDWMDLDSLVEVTLGPYETYEDDLMGLKGSFEAFVTVSDAQASAKLAKYKRLLPDMEKNLPIPPEARGRRGAESPIRVVDLVFTAGDARKSVQTIAFNLPNDERVRAEKGAKKVLLRNLIETKFDAIMRPIGERVVDPAQQGDLSSEAFFYETLFHELSHSIGPAFTQKGGKKVEVRVALEATFSALEEAKADVMGAYNVLYMVKRNELPKDFSKKLLASYFAGLFRSVRFGVAEAHGQGAALQINRFLEAGAARFDAASGRFTIDYDKLTAAIGDLVRDLCMVQHQGDKAKAEAWLASHGVMSDPIKAALAKLDGVAVDVRPVYPAAGEPAPPKP